MARIGEHAIVIGASMGGLLAAPARFDSETAAEVELDWCRSRREAASPDDDGQAIARVSRLIYDFDSEGLRAAGVMRARAMAYRDARDQRIGEGGWARIEEMLRLSYAALRAAIDRGPDGTR